ncbi:MAG: SBBP repeat-containing protein [Blastocatellia bacterium]
MKVTLWSKLRYLLFAIIIFQLTIPFTNANTADFVNNSKDNSKLTNQTILNKKNNILLLNFEKNIGQTDKDIDFIIRSNASTMFLSATKLNFIFDQENNSNNFAKKFNNQNNDAKLHPQLTMELIKANNKAKIITLEESSTKTNYLINNKPQNHVKNFTKVKYESIYPGIDIVYYGNEKQLEYDFIIAPNANPNLINLAFSEATKLTINEQGDLIIDVNGQIIYQKRPDIYQYINGNKKSIKGSYKLSANNQISFQIGGYDTTKTLIIDPIVGYSTFLGGTDNDFSNAIAVDTEGNTYLVGHTASINFPVSNFQQQNNKGKNDLFITKIAPDGNRVIYSTYIGGSDNDFGNAIAVDSMGNVYVAGYTFSSDFPVLNGFQPKNGNTIANTGGDAFILKLNAQGNTLAYSTYLGGMGDDLASSIAIDSQNNAYVTGFTNSANFPVANAIQSRSNGGFDAFVAKLNPMGSSLVYSTYFGGSDNDFGNAIAVDKDRNAYFVGVTDSRNFPAINPLQSTNSGDSDGFITKISATGNVVNFSTYFGGSSFDNITSIAVDNTSNIYLTGVTNSRDFTIVNAMQLSKSTSLDAFVSKLNPTGSNLVYSTYLGGNGDDQANSLSLDPDNNVYLTGVTTSTDFPLKDATQKVIGGEQDAFMTKLNALGTALDFSTYVGGIGSESGLSIIVDSKANVFMTGITNSMDFPMTKPLQNSCGCDFMKKISDGFVVSFVEEVLPPPPPASPDFSISFTQPQISFARGDKLDITVTITRLGGFTGNVTVTPDNDRAKLLKLKFTPTVLSSTSDKVTFSLKAKKKALQGTSPITFTAKDDSGKTKTAVLTLVIQ